MAFGGDNSQWSGHFPDDLIPDVLQLILGGWEQLRPVAPDAKEVPVTLRLCATMRNLKALRDSLFAIRPESLVLDPETGKELGRIDLEFTHGDNEDIYFAFECKRLYYQASDGKIRANVSEYTGNGGMMCFITQQYSRGLPHGGMIGYVLNGNVAQTKTAIRKSIEKNRSTLRLKPNTTLGKCALLPRDSHVAESLHIVGNRDMTIYHVLLAN